MSPPMSDQNPSRPTPSAAPPSGESKGVGARRQHGRRVLAAGLGVILSLLAAFAALLIYVDRFGLTDQARPADAIVVLGCKVEVGGAPSNSLRMRTLQAARLYRARMAPKIICTGGVGTNPPAE